MSVYVFVFEEVTYVCDRLLFFMTEVEGVVDRRILNDVAIIPNSNGTLPRVCLSPKCNVGLMIVVFGVSG